MKKEKMYVLNYLVGIISYNKVYGIYYGRM